VRKKCWLIYAISNRDSVDWKGTPNKTTYLILKAGVIFLKGERCSLTPDDKKHLGGIPYRRHDHRRGD